MQKDWWVLVGFLTLCFICEAFASFFTELSVYDWYPTLNKPFWNPPNWVFGPVWTFLYASMAIAAWLVWRKAGGILEAPVAFACFFIQLACNTLWSLFFFAWRDPTLAFYDILVLIVFVILTTYFFWRISKPAGYLMLPYLAWVIYASTLNAYIMIANG